MASNSHQTSHGHVVTVCCVFGVCPSPFCLPDVIMNIYQMFCFVNTIDLFLLNKKTLLRLSDALVVRHQRSLRCFPASGGRTARGPWTRRTRSRLRPPSASAGRSGPRRGASESAECGGNDLWLRNPDIAPARTPCFLMSPWTQQMLWCPRVLKWGRIRSRSKILWMGNLGTIFPSKNQQNNSYACKVQDLSIHCIFELLRILPHFKTMGRHNICWCVQGIIRNQGSLTCRCQALPNLRMYRLEAFSTGRLETMACGHIQHPGKINTGTDTCNSPHVIILRVSCFIKRPGATPNLAFDFLLWRQR